MREDIICRCATWAARRGFFELFSRKLPLRSGFNCARTETENPIFAITNTVCFTKFRTPPLPEPARVRERREKRKKRTKERKKNHNISFRNNRVTTKLLYPRRRGGGGAKKLIIAREFSPPLPAFVRAALTSAITRREYDWRG